MFREPFPILYVTDIDRSLRFYCDALGFQMKYRWPLDGAPDYVFLTLGERGLGIATQQVMAAIHGRPMSRQGPPQLELCLYVEDADGASQYLLSRGAKQLVPPSDRPWRERCAWFEDPDGNPIQITAKQS